MASNVKWHLITEGEKVTTQNESSKNQLNGLSVSVILTLVVHTIGLVWFFADLSANVTTLHESHKSLQQKVEALNNRQMSKEEILRLHDYQIDRVEKLEYRLRDIERSFSNQSHNYRP